MVFQWITTHPERLPQLLTATPNWTWGLLLALIVIGAMQLRARVMTARRAWSVSLLLAGLGFAGLLYLFGRSEYLGEGVVAWVVIAALGSWGFSRVRVVVRQAQATGAAEVSGSVVPLALILVAFVSRYAASLEIAMNPQVLHDSGFVLPLATTFGLVSGAFLARAWAISRAIRAVDVERPLSGTHRTESAA
jgi:hypothetical protein